MEKVKRFFVSIFSLTQEIKQLTTMEYLESCYQKDAYHPTERSRK